MYKHLTYMSYAIRWLLLFLMWSTLHTPLNAQEGKKAKPEPQGDPSSEAYVVEESNERVAFENDGTSTREYNARFRIQSDAGVEHLGVLTFSYQKATETVEIDFVRVRKPNGSIVSTPLEGVQDIPSNVTREAPFYSDLREKQIPVKGLSPGDILEYQVHWRQTKPLAAGQFWMAAEFFRDEAVLSQRIQVSVPRSRAVKVSSPELAPAVSEDGQRRTYTWTRANPEPRSPQKLEAAQLSAHGKLPAADILLSSFTSWEELGSWYGGLQRERIAPNPEIREKAAELTRGAADDKAKLQAIYKFVSSDFRYIGVDFGIGRYQPHFAAEVLSNQYGDCKDKHTLLASLLAAAGIPVYPALINSTRVIDLNVPSPAQFDHVISAVPESKGFRWLDTTAEVSPLGYLVPSLRDKQALVIFSDKPSVFQTTPADPPFPTVWTFTIKAKLNDNGTLEGEVEQTVRGDLEVQWRTALRSLPRGKWKDFIQQISYATGFAGEVIDVTASAPEATEEPLHFSYTYKRKDYPDWKNHRIVPPAPNIVGAPAEEDGKLPSRFWLGAPGELLFESRVELPKGFTADLPEDKDVRQDAIEYHSTYAQEGSVLVVHYHVLVKSREVAGSGVNDYKTFAERVHQDRDQFIPLSSGQPLTAQEAVLRMRNRVWELPDSTDPKAMRLEQDARSALQLGSFQSATDAFKHAVGQDPKFTRDWILLGEMYLSTMQRDAGLDALRKAVEADPKQPLSYKLLALTLTSLNRRSEAIQVWQDLSKVAPADRDIATNLGSLLVEEKRYREALPYLELAIRLYPERTAPLVGLGTAYLRSGDDEKALAMFEKVLKLETGAGVKNDVAYELADADKRLDEALRYADEAVHEEEDASRVVELDTLTVEDLKHTLNLAGYWDTLGWVHYRMGNLKKAEGYLYAAWTIQQNTVVGYHLGRVYEKQQRKQEAIHMYRLVANQPSKEPNASDAAADARRRMESLDPPGASGKARTPRESFPAEELAWDRTIKLPKLVSEHASAEFFLLFAPGSKVEDTKFISGSEELRSAGKALSEAPFKIAFPENSVARQVRRGILACYPISGCNFVLFPTDTVFRVD